MSALVDNFLQRVLSDISQADLDMMGYDMDLPEDSWRKEHTMRKDLLIF